MNYWRGIEGLRGSARNMNRAKLSALVLFALLIPLLPLQNVSAEQATVHQGAVEHMMFFIGEADETKTGSMSPADSSKSQEYELEITYQESFK